MCKILGVRNIKLQFASHGHKNAEIYLQPFLELSSHEAIMAKNDRKSKFRTQRQRLIIKRKKVWGKYVLHTGQIAANKT
jgi:hypothetical protein